MYIDAYRVPTLVICRVERDVVEVESQKRLGCNQVPNILQVVDLGVIVHVDQSFTPEDDSELHQGNRDNELHLCGGQKVRHVVLIIVTQLLHPSFMVIFVKLLVPP